jgi:hypothetical protein
VTAPARTRLIGAVHAAKKAAGLDDDTYRAKLQLIVGKNSAKDCSDAELRTVLDTMNGKSSYAPAKADSPHARKALALWISLYALGGISDPSEKALRAWVKRQHHVDDLAFVRASDGFAVVEGLKQWCARLGVQWGAYADPRLCVIERQTAMLRRRLEDAPDFALAADLIEADATLDDLDGIERNKLIVKLGRLVRGDRG